jgi:LCP family protein required for cell wall assembly
MTHTRSRDELGQADGVPDTNTGSPARRRRGLRITLLSLASVTVLLGATAAGAFFYVNHEVGSIPRIPVRFLAQEVSSSGETVLLTDGQATGATSTGVSNGNAGLIMVLHLNAGQTSGGVISIPPLTEVNVPGQGVMPIEEVSSIGGPSLLVETVHDLTGVPINHYARIDFAHVESTVDAVGGVTVTLPKATESMGYFFKKGANQISGAEVLAYTRDPSLTATGRVLRQQSLVRAIFDKIGSKHLLINPLTMTRVLNALTSLLTLDSNFSNSQVISLSTHLGGLAGSAATFVTAPTKTVDGSVVLNTAASSTLWSEIKNGSIAAFAKKYPATVTPLAP